MGSVDLKIHQAMWPIEPRLSSLHVGVNCALEHLVRRRRSPIEKMFVNRLHSDYQVNCRTRKNDYNCTREGIQELAKVEYIHYLNCEYIYLYVGGKWAEMRQWIGSKPNPINSLLDQFAQSNCRCQVSVQLQCTYNILQLRCSYHVAGGISMLESITGCVTMINRPFISDQMINQQILGNLRRIGVGLEGDVFTKIGTMNALDIVLSNKM